MSSANTSASMVDSLHFPLIGPLPAFSPLVAAVAILVTSIGVRVMLSNRSQIPIALSDNIASRKKRIDQYRFDSRRVLTEGYTQFKNQIFGLDTSEGIIMVLPTHFIDELKSHSALSFGATFDTLTLPEYTKIHAATRVILKLFIGKFNPSLGAFMPVMQTMFQTELLATLPKDNNWKTVKIYHILFHLVCKSAARSLLGEAAAENPRWLRVQTDYIGTAISYIQALKKWPKSFRPFVYRYVEGYSTLRKQWNEGRAIVADFLAKKKANNWEPLQQPPSFFDIVASTNRDMSVDEHLSLQITFFVAGVHTSAATSTQALFDAAVNADCISQVRKEIQQLHASCGGVIERQHLSQLPKLDSFIKEVLRFSSPDLATFVRKSSQDVTLSNGFHIPSGTTLEVATGAIAMDPEVFDDPKVFDGLRFWKKRQVENESVKHQFTSVSPRDLEWGYGRHACPGRYMAEVTIKLIMIQILLRFELKNPEGIARHESFNFDGQTMPNTEAEILIRDINA